jgi:hypothetical protein
VGLGDGLAVFDPQRWAFGEVIGVVQWKDPQIAHTFRQMYGLRIAFPPSQSRVPEQLDQELLRRFPTCVARKTLPNIWALVEAGDLVGVANIFRRNGAIGIELYSINLVHLPWNSKFPQSFTADYRAPTNLWLDKAFRNVPISAALRGRRVSSSNEGCP